MSVFIHGRRLLFNFFEILHLFLVSFFTWENVLSSYIQPTKQIFQIKKLFNFFLSVSCKFFHLNNVLFSYIQPSKQIFQKKKLKFSYVLVCFGNFSYFIFVMLLFWIIFIFPCKNKCVKGPWDLVQQCLLTDKNYCGWYHIFKLHLLSINFFPLIVFLYFFIYMSEKSTGGLSLTHYLLKNLRSWRRSKWSLIF